MQKPAEQQKLGGDGMAKIKDLTGKRYGKLVAVEMVGRSSDRKILWKCRCDCGNEVIRTANYLSTGHATNCGCAATENRRRASMAARKIKEQKKEGQTRSTICWDCVRSAAPPSLRCSWDSKKKLPKGAKAREVNGACGHTLIVEECPLFLSICDKGNMELLAAERKKASAERAKEVAESVLAVSSYGRERVNVGG